VTTRRDFIVRLGAAVGTLRTHDARDGIAPVARLVERSGVPSPPPSTAPSSIRFGYAAITWGGNDLQAIDDVSALGFKGIQLRSNVLERFGEKPAALRDLLAQHHLQLVALSSGAVKVDGVSDEQTIAEHVRHAQFVRDVGGLYLQVTDERPAGRAPDASHLAHLGRLLTSIGQRTADLGIPLGYHNHMGGLGERPDDLRRIFEGADPRYAKLLLDVAHFRQADGDPAQAIREYRDRLLFLHIKDVQRVAARDGSAKGAEPTYRFVELGHGLVDLPAVFGALRDVGFTGWAVIELDAVTEAARTPKHAAEINKKYVEDRLGLTVR
jgi:inosose dehydratase